MLVRFALAVVAACAATTALAADTGSVPVSAVLVSRNNCKFSTATKTLTISVKNDATGIDPTLTSVASGSATATFTCNGNSNSATFVVGANDGAHSVTPGVRRMQHSTLLTSFLPYSLSFSPASATVPKGTSVNVVITATVLASDYSVAAAGTYSDTVGVTVSP